MEKLVQGTPAPGVPDPRRPLEVSRGLFDRHHWRSLGSPSHLLLYLVHECRGQSPYAFGRTPRSLDQLHEATGVPSRTLRRWIKVLEKDHAGADESIQPHPYLRTWRFRDGLVFLVVERISFEQGRGRKADTSRYLDPAFRPELPGAKGRDGPRPKVAGVSGHKWPQTPEREVPVDDTGQGVLPLGPLGASTENRKNALRSKEASSGSGESGSGRSAPSGAPSCGKPRGQPPQPTDPSHVRALRRVLVEFPRLTELARRQAMQAGLVAAAGEARGVGLAALEHGFRCALEAVQRYQDMAGRPGVRLLSSLYAVVLRIVPGEAMRYNADVGERQHDERMAEDRAAARAFSRRIEQLVDGGAEYGEACTFAARGMINS